jgi:hypothetical protein
MKFGIVVFYLYLSAIRFFHQIEKRKIQIRRNYSIFSVPIRVVKRKEEKSLLYAIDILGCPGWVIGTGQCTFPPLIF